MGIATTNMCHSNPWHDTSVYISPSQPEALLKFVTDAVSEDIIVLEHTHHPMCIEVDGKMIVNPGSIYENRNRDERTCGILNLPDFHFDLYDIDIGQQIPL